MTIYAIITTSVLLWITFRSAGWRDKYIAAEEERERTQRELDFTKSTVVGLFNKPVYVSLSSDQVEQIAIMVSNRMKEQPDQWLN